jgi:hypothetical protein
VAKHAAGTRKMRNAYGLLQESHMERDHKEDQDVGWWMMLRWILER